MSDEIKQSQRWIAKMTPDGTVNRVGWFGLDERLTDGWFLVEDYQNTVRTWDGKEKRWLYGGVNP